MMLAIVCFGIIFQAFMLIDDTRGLRPATRLIIQSLASLGVIVTSGNYITNIGFEVLGWNGNLGYLGIFFTIFAVTGIINAFNMIDGINGLCSGVALVTFLFLAYLSGNTAMTYGSLIIISSLVGFLIYNLGLFGKNRAVFLGDNGSNFIGFLVGWSCINYSSDEIMLMNPTTALWLVAIPLWDCVTLIFKRLIAGSSALSGDRMHIHHILCDVGFSENKALVILLLGSLFLAITGVTIERIFDPVYSVILFISLGLTFVLCKSKFVSMAYSHK
jgi:UDP-GlcNAc:undecaprenyl-phosphate GlcNAc-1-phosphate transferase